MLVRSIRLAFAAIITILVSNIMLENGIGWHNHIPVEVWCLGHGLAVALTMRDNIKDQLSLPRVYMAYFVVTKGINVCIYA